MIKLGKKKVIKIPVIKFQGVKIKANKVTKVFKFLAINNQIQDNQNQIDNKQSDKD